MDKERLLYDKFIQTLINALDTDSYDTKVLNVIMNFLKNNDIQATINNNGLAELQEKISKLPFAEDENEAPFYLTEGD